MIQAFGLGAFDLMSSILIRQFTRQSELLLPFSAENSVRGSQVVMDGRMMDSFMEPTSSTQGFGPRASARASHRGPPQLDSTQERRTRLDRLRHLSVTLVRLDGEPLMSETILADAPLSLLAKAAARKLGGRAMQLFMDDERLDHDDTAAQCGLRDGCYLTAMPTTGVRRMVATGYSFCVLQADGSVSAWGSEKHGSVLGAIAPSLRRGVNQIFALDRGFIATKEDGDLVSWGQYGNYVHEVDRGDSLVQVVSCGDEFACLTAKGFVLVLEADSNGKQALIKKRMPHRVWTLFATDKSFAALTRNGGVIVWGDPRFGGDAGSCKKQLRSGVRRLVAGSDAFAVLKLDGSVITWGNFGDTDLPVAKLSSGIKEVFAAGSVFVAIKTDGSVVTWGYCKCTTTTRARKHVSVSTTSSFLSVCRWCSHRSELEEQISQCGGLLILVAAKRAYAALCNNGSVLTWGDPKVGGICCACHNADEDLLHGEDAEHAGPRRASIHEVFDVSLDLSTEVVQIVASDWAFAALRKGGDVVAWGDDQFGGSTAKVREKLRSKVKEVVSTAFAFAALREDGSVVTWGSPLNGGSPEEDAAKRLTDNVLQLSSTRFAFVALKGDGSIVTWGHPKFGGDSRGLSKRTEEGQPDDSSADDDSEGEGQELRRAEREKRLHNLRQLITAGRTLTPLLDEVRKRFRKRKAMQPGDVVDVEGLKVPFGLVARIFGVKEELDGKAKAKPDEATSTATHTLPNLVLHSGGKPCSSQKKRDSTGGMVRMLPVLPSSRPLRREAPARSDGSNAKNRQPICNQAVQAVHGSSRCESAPSPPNLAEADTSMAALSAKRDFGKQDYRYRRQPQSPQPGQPSRTRNLSPLLFFAQLDRADTEGWPSGTALALQMNTELDEVPGQPRSGAMHWLIEALPEVLALRRQQASMSPRPQKRGAHSPEDADDGYDTLLPVLPGLALHRGADETLDSPGKASVTLPGISGANRWFNSK